MAANRLRGDKGDYHVTHCCKKPIVLVTARASIVLDIQSISRASVANQNARKWLFTGLVQYVLKIDISQIQIL